MFAKSTLVFPLALALLVPLGAAARPRNERNVVIPADVQVGSTLLKAGTYQVEWQDNGPSLRVSFMENGKTVATAEGKMVERDRPWDNDEVVTGPEGKDQMLKEINFHGLKETLVITSDHPSTN